MNKIFTLIFILSYFFSQEQVKLGPVAGFGRSWFTPANSQSNLFFSYRTSALGTFYLDKLGIFSEIKLSANIFLQGFILMRSKGSHINTQSNFTSDTSSRILQILYLEFPVNILYKWKFNRRLHIFAGGGLYGARAFFGEENQVRDTDYRDNI